MRKLLAVLSLGLSACGCNLLAPRDPGLLAPDTSYTGSIPNPWYLYRDNLATGSWLKGLDFYTGASYAGTPIIDLACPTQAYSGTACMRLAVPAQAGTWWCGLILLQAAGFPASNASPGVDLSAGNFSKCVFMARLSQGSTQVEFQAFDNAANVLKATVTSSWQQFSVPLVNASNITHLRQFFVAGFSSGLPTATPLDLYIDDLRYEQ